ncbi:hypothetical protein [Dermatophilus congolensis]|uniref:Lipoprotein n=1 Tax=Dermatophilus congolensis TaxID=1863 RepID=A0AA46BP01_9MICO|nr:hypothetical protein [Dermatophilus congolensis]MBO3143360.1 hypothetical protein [Dermatophilus congolensis]MBO3152349.1 hypothetical protein [Dermatophilus congolensis]MBO3160640.1 hypothetical protein [Dermatophilus congolensis]MBO3163637.1 hypothetical protein [Dermatophilus congolensis]MBO3177183.1 hypothetical protein [Dermatophilus congolensis]
MAQPMNNRAKMAATAALALLISLTGCSVPDQGTVTAAHGSALPAVTPASGEDHAALNSAAKKGQFYLQDCDKSLVQRPSSFTLACADSNSALDSVKWDNWGDTQATGSAVLRENSCVPNCAEGKPVSYPVRIKATGALTANGAGAYTSIEITYTDKVPEGQDKTTVWSARR